ncbi:MAG: AAA family ATPase [Deltaproteobacteria bacterium]|jgi:tetratricopeptide (TPR) repeat protein|nr:AAA family ATPase [Deltaproteobacteria bacterium]
MAPKRIIKHNPAFLTKKELLNSFVVRNRELNLITKIILDNTGEVNQHIIIIAPRGMGKTMLIRRLELEVKTAESLNKNWYPVILPEELYDVSTEGELWLRVLQNIGDQEKKSDNGRLLSKHAALLTEVDEKNLRIQTLSALTEFAGKKKLMIVVENLQMLLGSQSSDDDAWDLRRTLLNNPGIMLVTTATTHFGQILKPEKANFELFREIVLSPLSSNESRTLWQSVTRENLENERIRPMEILTGGSPRLLTILADFAMGRSLKELLDNLVILIDDHTTYFKANVEALPPKERRVFVTLAELWQPSRSKDVAERCRLQINMTSALLKRLVEKGAVIQVDKVGRKIYYQISERLYNIYHLMRLSGRTADRVKALVNFMVPLYGEPAIANAQAKDACQMIGESRDSFIEGYQTIINQSRHDENMVEQIIKNTPEKFFQLPEAAKLNLNSASIHSLSNNIQNNNKIKKSSSAIELLEKAFSLNSKGKNEEAMKIYDDFIARFKDSKDNFILKLVAMALVGKGITLRQTGKPEEQLKVYDDVISRFKDSEDNDILKQVARALVSKGVTLGKTGKPEEQLKIYDDVISRFKNFKKLDLGIDHAKQAIRLNPENCGFRHTLASLLGMRDQWENAFKESDFFINDKEFMENASKDVISFFIDAAVAGHSKYALEIIKGTLVETQMEPLVVALKIVAGITFHAPREVVEIAHDIVKKIEKSSEQS